MNHDPFNNRLRQAQSDRDLIDQFKHNRLAKDNSSIEQWPAQIDNAALDILSGIAIGSRGEVDDIGATIGRNDFSRVTGPSYRDGLQALAGPNSPAASAVSQYEPEQLAQFGLQISNFQKKLRNATSSLNISQALGAVLRKMEVTDAAIANPSGASTSLPEFRNAKSASDLILRLLSDPEVEGYGTHLIETVTSDNVTQNQLISILDRPQMVTRLWEHQREALQKWYHAGQTGYVDMATATGKTVLGIAAIAARFGQLHPEDQELIIESDKSRLTDHEQAKSHSGPCVLIVASNNIILNQWRQEFDTHLDIPQNRTQPTKADGQTQLNLSWGRIRFNTAQNLLERDMIEAADLIILDEAHQYTREGQGTSRRWRDLFADLVEQSNAVLAMSGSVDVGWQGDSTAKEALEAYLEKRKHYTLAEARQDGVIADFDWTVHYAPIPADDENKIATQTRIITRNHKVTTGKLDTDALDITLANDQDNDFPTYSSLQSFIQSNDGRRLRNKSNRFDLFATAVQTRRPLTWHLSPIRKEVLSLVDEHASQQCIVLTQSYEEAIDLGDYVQSENEIGEVVILEDRMDDRTSKIQEFNQTPGATIIGPGRLLGTGVDFPDAEIAINIAKGGATAELVQRIGRVLRNPDGSKQARFYHIVPQPQNGDTIVLAEDGRRLLKQAAEFQTLGSSINETPLFTTNDTLRPVIDQLERAGAAHLMEYPALLKSVDSEQVRIQLRTVQKTVKNRTATADPVLTTTNWQFRHSETSSTEICSSDSTDQETSEISDADRAEIASLERLACDDTKNESKKNIRLTAVQRLATFGRGALKPLRRVAEESNCQNERVRTAAERAIEDMCGLSSGTSKPS
jgi:superfamily II DNA or RNA helicase